MTDSVSQVRPIILLGAGFSRNWGGFLGSEVFEYLLGCLEVRADDPYLRDLLWRNRDEGFEVALAELQAAFKKDRKQFSEPLRKFQSAIASMFEVMNSVFASQRFDFPPAKIKTSITHFLSQFDAIFTLNQDLLLESQYMACNFSGGEHYRKWTGQELPGLQLASAQVGPDHLRWLNNRWQPTSEADFQLRSGCQPIYKLHGSSNWIDEDGSELLIMGGGKEETIADHKILAWYAKEFSEALCMPNARLMIIGYGFRDHHINRTIARAVNEHGLKLFVIGPHGSDVVSTFYTSDSPRAAPIVYGYDLEHVFARSLIGASRRGLAEIFGFDSIEHAKVMRFFE
jgi:hypothetical protein